MAVAPITRSARIGAGLVLALATACIAVDLSDYQFDSSGTFLDIPEFGVSITEFEEWGSSARLRPNGTVELEGTALVTIDGMGARDIWTVAIVEPLSEGGRRALATVDESTGASRMYYFDEAENFVSIGDEDGGVLVFGNADGSYDVVTARFDQLGNRDEYEHAEDGIAAWKLVQQYNEFTSTSAYSLVMAYAMGQSPSLAARSMVDVGGNYGTQLAADGPAVCDIFNALCVCALCSVSTTPEPQCDFCELD